MTVIVAHWKKFIVLLLCIASFAVGRFFRPAQREKTTKTTDISSVKVNKDAAKETEAESAGTRKVVLDFNPNCAPLKSITLKDFAAGAPLPVGIVRATLIEAGPTTVVTRSDVVTARQEDRTVQNLTIDKPLPDSPQWAIGTGLQFLPSRALQLSLERRLAGPFWLTGWVVQPLTPSFPSAAGVGLRVEF